MLVSNAASPIAIDNSFLIDAARDAGDIAMDFFRNGYAQWDKGGDNPVTEADIAVNQMLHARLGGAFPGYGWLSEETEDNAVRLDANRVWIVDPIDGTRAFMRGEPHFTICIALVEAGRPIAAVVFNPATGECFEATHGGGARLNGSPIFASGAAKLDGARLLTSEALLAHKGWAEPWPVMHVEMRNSIAYRLALVASGQFDGCLSLSSKFDWDIAAADLILNEAGGCLSRRDGTPYIYNQAEPRHPGLIAAGGKLHALLLDRAGRWQPVKSGS